MGSVPAGHRGRIRDEDAAAVSARREGRPCRIVGGPRHTASMYFSGDDLVLSPTDLTKHLACRHATTLDLARARREIPAPATSDDALDLIFRLGLAHEADYLALLEAEGRSVIRIPDPDETADRAQREAETLEAMRSGVDVVFQATFWHDGWGGQADFLLRVERPSALGEWSYEIADTKLARRMKVPALLQMATYAQRLTELQGVEPEGLYVVTGDGQSRPWRLVDVAAYARRARARLRLAVETAPVTEGVPVAHCGQCRWAQRCDDQWRAADDLSQVAFLRRDHRQRLREHGITTLTQLGRASAGDLPTGIGASTRGRLVQQASLQLWEREQGKPRYELLPPEERQGLLRLPPSDAGDLYLDFEGDPYAEGGEGREYLAGLGDLGVSEDGTGFTALWAHDSDQEKQLTIDLVDRLLQRWRDHPGMHVYHYAPYETTALKRLVARHGVREAELDQLLRGERFVDLYAVVRQGMRISKGSYSIKKMEAFYWGHIRNDTPEVADAMGSVIAYEAWSVQADHTTLGQILDYNRDDVRSTRDLHVWLEQRRGELEDAWGAQPRPDEKVAEPESTPNAREQGEIDLTGRLTAAGEPLLASLVQFHRREARPEYWDLFRLADLDDDELVDDGAALGRLTDPVDVGPQAKSRLYRYEFPPQDTKIKVGDGVFQAESWTTAVGTVVELDATADPAFIVLKRQGAAVPAQGLTNKSMINDDVIRDAIAAVAEDRLAGIPCLGSALLDREVPPELTDVVKAGLSLAGQVLAVQGPPGTGKTTAGAELVRQLLDRGLTVGVTSNSHAVLGHFLAKVDRPGVQKCTADQHCGSGQVAMLDKTQKVLDALADGAQLVGGTAWLWSHADMAGAVDVIVIDEAGQFSLANAVAVSRAARSMVLLGDPQQLAQPTKALHPEGAEVSALGHMIDGHDTIPLDRGVFLTSSYRMHPALTAFISELAYDGRLASAAGREKQRLDGGPWTGSGLRVVEVDHAGNGAASAEEAAVVAAVWKDLVGGQFTDHTGAQRALTPGDVVVVAPYINQVGLIRALLPDGARVGTVDKFQGTEAPVAIYSMTSSSVADAPRGVSFLYDVHRLNVAVSRAQAMAIVVLSPTLLEAPVSNPEQLRQVNALCRLVEESR